MKLNKLVSTSDKLRKLNAKLVRVVQIKTGKDRKGNPTVMAKTYTPREVNVHYKIVPARDKSRYVSSIKFIDNKLNVKVSCSCPDYLFRWEVANHQAGCSDIVYSNGEPPLFTNPSMTPSMCKHLLALRGMIKTKYGV